MDYEQDDLSFFSRQPVVAKGVRQRPNMFFCKRCTFGWASCGFLHVPVTHVGDTCDSSSLRTLSYPGFVEYWTGFVEYLLGSPVYLVGTIIFRGNDNIRMVKSARVSRIA
jgi:hypothetical protein